MTHVVTLLTRQPGFDRGLFLEDLRGLSTRDDQDKTFRTVYETFKDQIVSNIEADARDSAS
jgi:hypothetical protein